MGYADGGYSQPEQAEQPARRSPKTEKAVQTTLARGESLFFDGYTMDPTQSMGVYIVTTPERLDKKTGELYVIDYTVDVVAGTCNCTMFQRAGVCKHLRGARKRLDEAQRAYNEAVRLLSPIIPQNAAQSDSSGLTVNGRRMTSQSEADAYRRELDFA